MFALLKGFIDTVIVIVKMVISSVKSLVLVVTYIPRFITFIRNLITYSIPNVYRLFIAICMLIGALYLLIDRRSHN